MAVILTRINRITSKFDKSVNWIYKYGKGELEARYVRRNPEKVSAYLSSHSGCKMNCKFCWLTQQNQQTFDHTTLDAYKTQYVEIMDHYKTQEPAKRVNINLMARGEAFANKIIVNEYGKFHDMIEGVSQQYELPHRINISTIMPYTIRDRDLFDTIGNNGHIYYSMYSVSDKFRSEWMPNAINYREALDKLKKYQEKGGNEIVFHWTFIEGENDKREDVMKMAKIIESYKFNAKFNLVRYNPHSNLVGSKESPHYKELFEIIKESLNNDKSYIVPRIGIDAKASCGMFVTGYEIDL